eukprot:gene15877-biopygen12689
MDSGGGAIFPRNVTVHRLDVEVLEHLVGVYGEQGDAQFVVDEQRARAVDGEGHLPVRAVGRELRGGPPLWEAQPNAEATA